MNAKGSALAAFAFIAMVMLMPAYIWHCKCRNVPAIFLITWILLDNLIGFINAIAWSDEKRLYEGWKGQGYCDIAVKVQIGASPGKVTAICALALNLYMVLCANNPTFMGSSPRKKLAIELGICGITPLFVMAVNYVIQAGRYDILRYAGCVEPYSSSAASVALGSLWTFLWALVAIVIAILLLVKYFQRRRELKDILRCTNSGLNVRRFARLLIFSLLIVLVLGPLSIYYFATDAYNFRGKFSWRETHGPYWHEIFVYDAGFSVTRDVITNICLSAVTFIIFGLGSDALSLYKTALSAIGISFGKKRKDNELFKGISSVSDQGTRVSSNRSKVSNTTAETSSPQQTLTEHFHSKYEDLYKDDEQAIDLKGVHPNIQIVDMEKGSSSNEGSLLTKNVTQTPEECFPYILDQDIDLPEESYQYSLKIESKK